jgi:hypothetical protein
MWLLCRGSAGWMWCGGARNGAPTRSPRSVSTGTRLASSPSNDALMVFRPPAVKLHHLHLGPASIESRIINLQLATALQTRHGQFLRSQGSEGSCRCKWKCRCQTGKAFQLQNSTLGREIVRSNSKLPQVADISLTFSSRPKTLSDVTAQDHTVTVLQRTLQSSNVRANRSTMVNKLELIIAIATTHALLRSTRYR